MASGPSVPCGHRLHPCIAENPPWASLSPQDMADYVAYVAKDPINQRGEARWVQAGPCGLERVSQSRLH